MWSHFHFLFPVLDLISFLNSSYERPNRTVHLKNVPCSGNEESINACTKTSISLAVGKTTYRNSPVVAVDCSPEPPTEPTCLPKQGLVIPVPSCSFEKVRDWLMKLQMEKDDLSVATQENCHHFVHVTSVQHQWPANSFNTFNTLL